VSRADDYMHAFDRALDAIGAGQGDAFDRALADMRIASDEMRDPDLNPQSVRN
jgi:hypothetical protein